MSGAFIDSNILVYAFSDDSVRRQRAEDVLQEGDTIGVQCLNEFVSVATRKLNVGWDEIDAAIIVIEQFCPSIVPLTLAVHRRGVDIARRYRMAIYDAMIVAAALSSGCDTLYSEDMHHGLVVDARLTIVNPFA